MVKNPRKANSNSVRIHQLAEPINITGPTVALLKFEASAAIAGVITVNALILYNRGFGFGSHDILSSILVFFGMIFAGLVAVRVAIWQFSRLVFRLAPLPERTRADGSLSFSRERMSKCMPTLIVMILMWPAGYLGPPLVASAVIVGYACMGLMWALQARVIAIDSRQLRRDELEAFNRLGSRVRRGVNGLLSQWFAALSAMLAMGLILFTVTAVVAPAGAHLWRWTLFLASAYVIIGSLLRAAAETQNRLWVEIDVVRLWKVSKQTFLQAAATAGVGAALGALIGCFVWLAGHGAADGQALDMIGRFVTGGTVVGAVAGMLTVPRLAFMRYKELWRGDRDQRTRSHQS